MEREAGRRWWPFILGTIAILIGVSLVFPAGRHQWALSFVRQQTHYTTLSFVGANSLPTTYVAGAPLHLTFRVQNHEEDRIRYTYILSNGNDSTDYVGSVLHEGSVTVPAGGQGVVSVSVVPNCASSPCRVQVALKGYSESIDVIVDRASH